MGKRKRSRDTEAYLLKKIRKLEKKVLKRRCSSDSSSLDSENEFMPENESLSDCEIFGNESNEMEDPIVPTTPQNAESAPVPIDKNIVSEPEINLDENILALLGDSPKDESPLGKDIHKYIATRFQNIIQNGLKKEDKQKLKEDYPIPGNCLLFTAPILSAEVKAAVSNVLYKKDLQFAERQSQIGVVLSALTNAIQTLASNTSDTNQSIIKHISDASKILCDIHCIDTKLRRNFMLSALNDKLKDTLKDAKRDKYLFGEDLAEKLKTNKAIQKSSQDLKGFQSRYHTAKTNPQPSTSNLNWKRPQSKPQAKNRRPASTVQRPAGQTTLPPHQESTHRHNSRNVSRGNAHYKTRKS